MTLFDDYPETDGLDAEARWIGEDRAGTPSWSKVSARRLRSRLEALLASAPEEKRAELATIEAAAYDAALERRQAMATVGE